MLPFFSLPPRVQQVGFNAGDQSSSYVEQYSAQSNRLPRMVTESNMQVAGQWLYHVSRYEVDIRECNTAGRGCQVLNQNVSGRLY